ncbi:50S ribosomal protein L6 [Helcococcus kunzii]|uniref:Large ribosomal subunit protein uL6 n=1 Tax=Helcococcus kunzii ATCC 51366 TaxID=883114 RepID=H3NP53_9FIRM|nr:50S ribosomal protein L6 [Helcococcus kunzii]EHR33515.1 ribosomal protein L6 [Helcococcus kunzii ATCC 51366]MCT1795777.1 50S ribosomal protein L6 [Helcococcus kunzii]MCT1989356.1 50S ribosomal protein L6 [Helcococcus kunzii]QUY65019.1 50S ribosomal protein L6 [Helcococcus kunzii]QZO75726.1 50S ribosomal protein L6 [Helcococcus kunzii]
MSRIGLKPIEIPAGVEIKFTDGLVEVKGPKGNLSQEVGSGFKVNIEEGQLSVERPSESKNDRSLHGLYRTLIQNMVIGVTEGYSKQLEIVGTGYRAQKQGNKLNLSLGFSHPLVLEDPEGITTEVPSERVIIIKGIDKQLVGDYTAKIRAYRRPEPYKGKGVKYSGEHIRRKVGKTGK